MYSYALSSRPYVARKTYQLLLGVGSYLTDTPVCELLASGMASTVWLTLGGIGSPPWGTTLDNGCIKDKSSHRLDALFLLLYRYTIPTILQWYSYDIATDCHPLFGESGKHKEFTFASNESKGEIGILKVWKLTLKKSIISANIPPPSGFGQSRLRRFSGRGNLSSFSSG